MKALLDTCVILDVLQNREPFFQDGKEIFLAAANQRFSGFITAKAVTDIYYLVHRKIHSDTETRCVLADLLTLFSLLNTEGADCRLALSSDISDYEDAVMAESAMRERMDCIVTRNLKDYAKAKLPVYSPGEFLKELQAEKAGI